jgi:hypothetical protein
MNIKTKKNGFNLNDLDYVFQDFQTEQGLVSSEIVSDSQLIIGTNDGLIFLDLSCTINGKTFKDINEFLIALINE